MRTLKDQVIFITGGSRGIGLAIAKRAARDGAKIVIAAKSSVPNPKLPGTIYSAAEDIRAAGGEALALKVDVREEDSVRAAIEETVKTFGGLDILINNASAIWLAGTLDTPMKRFDLMHQVNVRGTYLCSQLSIPYLRQSKNPHILNLAPPLNMNSKWFAPHTAYTIAKYGMSQCVLGMAEEFKTENISINALWPRTIIHTDALNMIPGIDLARTRKPEIVADAAWHIFTAPRGTHNGHFFLDEIVLRAADVTDFAQYAEDPNQEPLLDLFLD